MIKKGIEKERCGQSNVDQKLNNNLTVMSDFN